jgi:hypothetical protein
MYLQLGWYGKAWLGYVGLDLGWYIIFKSWLGCPEMEFLDINFDKRLESFDPCWSQSLLLADFKKTILYFGFKNIYKKSTKLEYIHEQHIEERKNEVRKLESEKTQVYAQKPRLKIPFKNSISRIRTWIRKCLLARKGDLQIARKTFVFSSYEY